MSPRLLIDLSDFLPVPLSKHFAATLSCNMVPLGSHMWRQPTSNIWPDGTNYLLDGRDGVIARHVQPEIDAGGQEEVHGDLLALRLPHILHAHGGRPVIYRQTASLPDTQPYT